MKVSDCFKNKSYLGEVFISKNGNLSLTPNAFPLAVAWRIYTFPNYHSHF